MAVQRSVPPSGVHRVEAALRLLNKLLQPFLHLAGVRSGDGLVSCILTRYRGSLALDEFFCPSLVFVGVGTAVDANSNEAIGKYMFTTIL